MKKTFKLRYLLLLGASVAFYGCKSAETKPSESAPAAPAPAPVATPAPAPVAAPAPAPVAATTACKPQPDGSKTKSTKQTTKGKEPVCVEQPQKVVEKPVPAAPVAVSSAHGGGYDLSKNKPVTDSTKVQSGDGTQVKGINDWEGEITGIPAANSKFKRLKIGMSLQEATDIVGQPTDQGAYVTAKAFIPFYYGSDKTRWETVYKGHGRLIFSTQAGFGSGQYLTWIIHNANEQGYR